jgi:diguanylate cyclase (GGDEF)-like protein
MFYAPRKQRLIDEEYVQLLFSVYCHQFTGIEGIYRDSLTGLYNRRAFDQRMQSLVEYSRQPVRRSRLSQPAVFAMLDIDHFKRINDRHGHVIGDEILAEIARMMTESFREYDLLFRYGGEEFALVLMDMDEALSHQALERFRHRVEDSDYPHHETVTISIGYCRFDAEAGVQGLIERADQALYSVKHNGRNRVQRFPLS